MEVQEGGGVPLAALRGFYGIDWPPELPAGRLFAGAAQPAQRAPGRYPGISTVRLSGPLRIFAYNVSPG
jgi:hypothetical protein